MSATGHEQTSRHVRVMSVILLASRLQRSRFDRGRLADKPASSHARNRVEREPLRGVLLRDAALGQKRQRGKGEESALRAGMPPAAMAGKNLNRLRPMSNPRMMSPAVAMPGRKGIPDARAFLLKDSVRPGETMNRAPASRANSFICSGYRPRTKRGLVPIEPGAEGADFDLRRGLLRPAQGDEAACLFPCDVRGQA